MKRFLTNHKLMLISASVVVLLDQLTKSWVRANLPYGQVYRPDLWISQYIGIVHVQNTGAILGILQNMNGFFVVLSFVMGAAILYYYFGTQQQEWLLRLGMGILLGGVIGNLIDRLIQHYVTDFIALVSLSVLNLADVGIAVGAVITILGMQHHEQKAPISESPEESKTPFTP